MNHTHRKFPRTLAEAFPRHPQAHFVDDNEWDGHKVLEYALIVLVVTLPIFLWVI